LVPGVATAQQPIRIGASISLTGTYAKPGVYGRDGYVLCQKQVNARGGLFGRKIEFALYRLLRGKNATGSVA
jgi:branched-chain amino acid transport system substrate-binding protein